VPISCFADAPNFGSGKSPRNNNAAGGGGSGPSSPAPPDAWTEVSTSKRNNRKGSLKTSSSGINSSQGGSDWNRRASTSGTAGGSGAPAKRSGKEDRPFAKRANLYSYASQLAQSQTCGFLLSNTCTRSIVGHSRPRTRRRSQ